MVVDSFLGGRLITRPQGVDDRAVLVRDGVPARRARPESGDADSHLAFTKRGVAAREERVARGVDEKLVELPIQLDALAGLLEGHSLESLGHRLLTAHDLGESLVRRDTLEQSSLHGETLDETAHLHQLGGLTGAEGGHPGATPGLKVDQSLGREDQQRFTDRGARDPHLVGDVLFVDEPALDVRVGEQRAEVAEGAIAARRRHN